ncbi:DUF454 family protein [Ligilactobacillus pobuzihii]|uniref:DUF454 family protein n=1 Tax=Ligilactobacillus pobuzihii TaxID=449659 RepID=UPI000374810B|nr:DUF454 family protein [Ligilactobacillus pobuzihii]GEN48286.1 hypothetical protein LPO01_10780 [Ligilactobacillus pobuzihii]
MTHSITKLLWCLLTIVAFTLGLIGLALPVLPQLPFLITGFFGLSKVSPRFHHWITNTKVYKMLFGSLTTHCKQKKQEFEERGIKWYESLYLKMMSVIMVQD